MLCFVIALKSKAVSKNWARVSALFEMCLTSAYNQIDPDFRIVVVCHETPQLSKQFDQRVEIINVDFSPPQQLVTTLTMQDKWRKLAVGMIRAGELNPNFIMIVDADDLVSRRLAQFVNCSKHENGWMLKHGYNYTFGSRWTYLNDKFSCGSDSIVNSRLIKFPKDLNDESINNCIVLRWGHTIIGERLAELGTPLRPLPFKGAMQIVNHGDNDSSLYTSSQSWYGVRHFFGKMRRTRLLTQPIRTEFSI